MGKKVVEVFLETLAAIHIASVGTFWLVGWAVLVSLLFSSYWYIAALYLAWWAYDKQTPYRQGRRLTCLRNWCFWRYLANYFPVRLHKTVDLDPSKNYLFAFHPHGFIPFGCFVNFCTNATGFDELFPGIIPHGLSINAQFMAPFYREYALANSVESVSADAIDYKLSQIGPGHSVVIVVGGGAEMMLSDHNAYTFKLIGRNGFVRRALKTGAHLVPVFSFGEHRVFEIPVPAKGSLLDYYGRFMKRLAWLIMNANSFPPICFYGRWRWLGNIVPRNVPINTVIGPPVEFMQLKFYKKDEEPSEELVNEYHQMFLDAMQKLYDDNKARFGEENTPLIFV